VSIRSRVKLACLVPPNLKKFILACILINQLQLNMVTSK